MNSPITQRDTDDSGDATQRNYRYQYAYGVILLVAATMKTKDFRAIWCEQQEDLLCEIDEDLFDAVQVKTQQPESGFWQTNTDAFVKSIQRFVALDGKYPGAIRRFAFASKPSFWTAMPRRKLPNRLFFCYGRQRKRKCGTTSAA